MGSSFERIPGYVRRRVGLAGALLLGLALGVLASLLARSLVTPGEAEDARDHQEPSLLVVPVESVVVEQILSLRVDIAPLDSLDVVVPFLAADASIPVVTSVSVVTGDRVSEGDVVGEVSGRPIIAMSGSITAFRDLEVGVSGPDVLQLEEGLERLGLDTGAVDGTYDAETAAGVAMLFLREGYAPPDTAVEVAAELGQLHLEVDNLLRQEAELKPQLSAALAGPSAARRASLDAQIVSAEIAVLDAKAAIALATDSADKDTVAETRAALDLTRTELALDSAKESLAEALAGGSESALLVAQRDRLVQQRHSLEQQIADAAVRGATPFPRSNLVFVSFLPAMVEAVPVELGDVLDGPIVTLGRGSLVGIVEVPSADASLVSVGQTARIFVADDGGGDDLTATGLVVRIGQLRQGIAVVEVEIHPVGEDPLPTRANGLFELTVASSGEASLAVPLAAITTDAQGQNFVTVVREGEPRELPVELGITNGSLIEIVPLDTALDAGESVLIGIGRP